MNNTVNTLGMPANFPKGYGKFPYIIIRPFYATFIQVPIHFNVENEDTLNYPGVHVNDVSPELIALYQKDKKSPLHDLLIEHTLKIKKRVDAHANKHTPICLVESEQIAYYINENYSIQTNTIPFGGTLMTQTHKFIGMGVKHFQISGR